jgi:hypothetical protein
MSVQNDTSLAYAKPLRYHRKRLNVVAAGMMMAIVVMSWVAAETGWLIAWMTQSQWTNWLWDWAVIVRILAALVLPFCFIRWVFALFVGGTYEHKIDDTHLTILAPNVPALHIPLDKIRYWISMSRPELHGFAGMQRSAHLLMLEDKTVIPIDHAAGAGSIHRLRRELAKAIPSMKVVNSLLEAHMESNPHSTPPSRS